MNKLKYFKFFINSTMTLSETQLEQEIQYDIPYHYFVTNKKLINSPDTVFIYPSYLSKLQRVKKMLEPFKGQKILDAGCGDGRFCYELKDENINLHGIDYSKKAIKFAKEFNPNTKFTIGNLNQTSFKDNYFDQIVLLDVIEHIFPKKIKNVIKEINRILNKNGKLIITVPHTNRKLNKKHYQHFNIDSLREALSPYFYIQKATGHHKISKIKNIFFKTIIFLYNAVYIVPRLKKLANILKNIGYKYFKNHLDIGKPDKCDFLFTVCRKI